jgi:hypothetical protein
MVSEKVIRFPFRDDIILETPPQTPRDKKTSESESFISLQSTAIASDESPRSDEADHSTLDSSESMECGDSEVWV